MRRSIAIVLWLCCQHTSAQDAAKMPPILVLDSGGHTSSVRKVMFSPDGRELISVSTDKTIRFWDVASGEPTRVLRPPIGPGAQGMLLAAALSRDGQTLAVGGYGLNAAVGSIYIISTRTGQIEQVLKDHQRPILSLALANSPDGRLRLASASSDQTARIWDLAKPQSRPLLDQPKAFVYSLAFSPDGSRLATASSDKTVRIWSVDGGPGLVTHESVTPILAVAWSPEGDMIAIGGSDRSVSILRSNGAPVTKIDTFEHTVNSIVFAPHSPEILCTWGDPKEQGFGASFVHWPQEKERLRFTKHDRFVYSGAISPDGTIAATAGGSLNDICLWKTSDGQLVRRLASKARPTWSVGWSPDGKAIAWGNSSQPKSRNDCGQLERSLSLADLESRPLPDATYRRAQESRGSLALQPIDASSLQVRQRDAVLATINLTNKDESIRCFSFVTADRVAVSGDSGLFLYDARTGKRIRVFQGYTDVVSALAPSPDGRYLVSASVDQIIRIYDPDQPEPLLSVLPVADEWIAWTAEGHYAASPGGEKFMGWQISNGPEQLGTFAAASQFRKSFFRPDLIKLLLRSGRLSRALEVAVSRSEPPITLKAALPPSVEITSPRSSLVISQQSDLEVRVLATAAASNPVIAFTLLVDGRPYDGPRARKLVSTNSQTQQSVTENWSVRLEPGKHVIHAVAEASASSAQSDAIEVHCAWKPARRANLYALVIGISEYNDNALRLGYAAEDAGRLEAVLTEKSARAFSKVEVHRLVDRQATRPAIINELAWLRNVMSPDDVAVLFFAGHGLRDEDGLVYMLPTDVSRTNIEASAIETTWLGRKLAGIKGRLLILLDVGHSVNSEGTGRQLVPNADNFLRFMAHDDVGAVTISSTASAEVSIENSENRGSLFCQALLEGLSGKADSNNDGIVYVQELGAFLNGRVSELSNNRQHTTLLIPANVAPFVVSKP